MFILKATREGDKYRYSRAEGLVAEMANKLNRTQTIALGVAAASLAALLLWQILGSNSGNNKGLAAADDDDLKKSKKAKGGKSSGISVTTPSGKKGTGDAEMPDEKTPLTSNARSAETKSLHSKIEEIDRRGKALFKGKK
jgi:hypothetical protein